MNNFLESKFSLKGKVAFISGAYGYLGKSISEGLGLAGAHLLLNGRNSEKLNQLVSELKNKNISCEAALFDINKSQDIEIFFEKRKNQPLHILVNNAYTPGVGSSDYSNAEDFRNSFETSVVASFNLFKSSKEALLLASKKDGDASVINIASMYGMVAPDLTIYSHLENANSPHYGASKAALLQLTRYLSSEFGKSKIRINSISPGPFPNLGSNPSPGFIDILASKTALHRVGTPEELQGAAVFLASNSSSFITGTNIVVDGGWTIK